MFRRYRAAIGGMTLLAMTACLPAGEPPRGRQLLVARDLEEVLFVEPAPGAQAGIAAFRFAPHYDPDVCASFWSLFAVDEATAPDELATERLLADGVEHPGPFTGYDDPSGPSYGLRTDARGRLFVGWQPPTPAIREDKLRYCPPGRGRIARIDATSGERTELGRTFTLAPETGSLTRDRTRAVFAGATGPDQTPSPEIVARDVDDLETVFSGSSPVVIGDAIYALDANTALVSVQPGSPPRTVVSGVLTFQVFTSPAGTRLLLKKADAEGTSTLFDPATNEEIVVPPTSGYPLLSPSGRFIVWTITDFATDVATFSMFDTVTRQIETRTFAKAHYSYWRPGTGKDELWIDAADFGGKLYRWTPGAPEIATDLGEGHGDFTEDGRYWLRSSNTSTSTEARDPDNPGAPGYVITPPKARVAYVRSLPEGRLLVEANVATTDRYDILVVDPVARTSRPIASGGHVLVVGRTRVLAQLKWIATGRSGELSLVDLETGATTVLAENAYRWAVEPPPPGEDPLAPGLRVLAVVRNRVASPYDGLWLSRLP
jgi:hypothetical protein